MRSTIFKSMVRSVAAVAVAAGVMGGASAQAQTTNLLSLTTFETGSLPPFPFSYIYPDGSAGYHYVVSQHYEPEDFEYLNGVFMLGFDISAMEGATGYGAGAGGALILAEGTEPSDFVSFNRGDYIFTFEARVDGLAEGQTSANGAIEVQFYYPVVVEEQAQLVKSFQVTFPFQPTVEWQTFSFALDEGSISGGTSAQNFAQHYQETTEVRFLINFHEPHHQFGWEGENQVLLNDLRLEVVDAPGEPPVTVPETILDWDFDTRNAWYNYPYDWSQTSDRLTVTAGNNANGNSPNEFGVDGSSGWFLGFDNSIFGAGTPPTYAGAGTGGGGPADYTKVDSGDLVDYRVTFDARVEGLNPAVTSSSGVMQIFVNAPDDTLGGDEDGNADRLIHLNVPIAGVSADWQTYSALLSDVNVAGGSREQFAEFHSLVSELQFQMQFENAAAFDVWEYDANNMLVIDNLRMERMYPVTGGGDGPELSIVQEGNEIVITWEEPATGTVTLESSETVDGEYTAVEGATSGYRAPIEEGNRFFRLSVQE